MAKILHFHSALGAHEHGGAETFIRNFLEYTKDQHDHILIGSTKSWQEIFRQYNQTVIPALDGFEAVTIKNLLLAPISFILGAIVFFRYYRVIQSVDVLFIPLASYTAVYFVLPWVELFFRKPIVFIVHNNCTRATAYNPLRLILQYFWSRYPVIFNTQTSLYSFTQAGFKPTKPIIIYQGVVSPETKDITVLPQGQSLRLGYLGRISPEKGLVEVLAILTKYIDQLSIPVELWIGGDGSLFKELSTIYASTDKIKITWLGYIHDKTKFYQLIDLLVFPSKLESFGLSLVESWAYGVPVLTTDLEVFLELKSLAPELERKLIFSLNKPETLLDKLSYFWENFAAYRNLEYAQSLRNTVKQYFDFSQQLKKYKQVLQID